MLTPKEHAAALPCWSQTVVPQPLAGGITNTNFVVQDGEERFVVRIGSDIPVHGVMRFNERAASRAAHACGLSPEVVYAESGALVIRFLEGKTFSEEDIRQDATLQRILPLLKRCHHELPRSLEGPVLAFWPFWVMRSYASQLRKDNSRIVPMLARLMDCNDKLEATVGDIQVVFGHNDLLGGNFIDNGERIRALLEE